MVNQTPESRLSPQERHTLDGLRALVRATNCRIAQLNRSLAAAERGLAAELAEARRLAYVIKHHELFMS